MALIFMLAARLCAADDLATKEVVQDHKSVRHAIRGSGEARASIQQWIHGIERPEWRLLVAESVDEHWLAVFQLPTGDLVWSVKTAKGAGSLGISVQDKNGSSVMETSEEKIAEREVLFYSTQFPKEAGRQRDGSVIAIKDKTVFPVRVRITSKDAVLLDQFVGR